MRRKGHETKSSRHLFAFRHLCEEHSSDDGSGGRPVAHGAKTAGGRAVLVLLTLEEGILFRLVDVAFSNGGVVVKSAVDEEDLVAFVSACVDDGMVHVEPVAIANKIVEQLLVHVIVAATNGVLAAGAENGQRLIAVRGLVEEGVGAEVARAEVVVVPIFVVVMVVVVVVVVGTIKPNARPEG